ncbi:SDR family NAD(P)-dependent oxidoreductase [Xanthomonas hyacinthi]|uniref:Dehydrogenase n=2 Tax=Xanthomonas hyacinthi TaxID=56455 RepID=A0A2S7EZD6_9XANT|nr:dehydrogenase [Xanthomonas hyacinthi]QGY75175.1 SDR family NAD(P)-dependent oxidoreductase [Xanthomonas hyacinthi]
MTGATGGLGAHAAALIAARPETRLFIGARGSGRSGPTGTEVLQLDLASLASVRAFAEAIKKRLDGRPIDRLVLNGGVQYSDMDQRSADGFEAAFAVNHLAHYLLARLLLPCMAENGRLVITTSDTHDPRINPLAPRSLDPQTLAHPKGKGGPGAGMRAYSASKLCNLLTARTLSALDEATARRIEVIAYNPGFTLGTSLMRTAPPWMRNVLDGRFGRSLLLFVSRFLRQLYPGTPERAGDVLAQLVEGELTLPPGRIYVSLVRGEVTFPDPSPLALSDEAAECLWRESAAMVGVN